MRLFLERLRPYAPLSLRLVIAVLAVTFAIAKVMHGMGDFTRQVVSWGMTPVWAQVLAWTSLVGGFLMALGFLTRLAALGVAFVWAMVIYKTKLHAGWQGGLDFPLLTLAGCVSLALSGAGRPSIDSRIFGE